MRGQQSSAVLGARCRPQSTKLPVPPPRLLGVPARLLPVRPVRPIRSAPPSSSARNAGRCAARAVLWPLTAATGTASSPRPLFCFGTQCRACLTECWDRKRLMLHLSVGSTRCLDWLSAAVGPESKEEVERTQAAQTKARKEARASRLVPPPSVRAAGPMPAGSLPRR